MQTYLLLTWQMLTWLDAADSNFARDSFKTFIPLSLENSTRSEIIFSFFDLISALAAHGKSNGFGGRKLSRMAAWWAFEQKDTGNGFEGGYKSWLRQVLPLALTCCVANT